MARCDFCNRVVERGTGKKYVLKNGKILDFCSNKCEKNLIQLKRTPRTTKWTLTTPSIPSTKKEEPKKTA